MQMMRTMRMARTGMVPSEMSPVRDCVALRRSRIRFAVLCIISNMYQHEDFVSTINASDASLLHCRFTIHSTSASIDPERNCLYVCY